MLFCGSIVQRGYRWDQLKNLGNVVNDCGTKDIWPVLAESTTWGYGASGTFGFGSPSIVDRFHPMRHSDYFARDFVERYWLPWICHGTLVKSSTEADRPTAPYWLSLLTVIHLKYLFLLIVPAIAALWMFLR
jgi:hypothetical protein